MEELLIRSFRTTTSHLNTRVSVERNEPKIQRSELNKVLKSAYADCSTVDIPKTMADTWEDFIHRLCNVIWKAGRMLWSNIYSTFKKVSPNWFQQLQNNQMLNQVDRVQYASTVVFFIINNRLKATSLPEIPEEQFGFSPDKCTRKPIMTTLNNLLKTLMKSLFRHIFALYALLRFNFWKQFIPKQVTSLI